MTKKEILLKKVGEMVDDGIWNCGCPHRFGLIDDCNGNCAECWQKALKDKIEYTEEQWKIFEALKTLGFYWIACDGNYPPYVFAYKAKPTKDTAEELWEEYDDEYTVDLDQFSCITSLVKWKDDEPFEIPTRCAK